jgi:hypothetical protein
MRRVSRWMTPRWRTATALVALALGVSAFGAFALPWLRADVPRANGIGVAQAESALDAAIEERRCRFHRQPTDL